MLGIYQGTQDVKNISTFMGDSMKIKVIKEEDQKLWLFKYQIKVLSPRRKHFKDAIFQK